MHALICNSLSVSRIFLGLLFVFFDSSAVRVVLLVLAGLSDILDGALARRWGIESALGTWLDPLTDKCFMILVLIGLIFFTHDPPLSVKFAMVFLLRDLILLVFALFMGGLDWCSEKRSRLGMYQLFSGKLFTCIQFFCAVLFLFRCSLPWWWGIPFLLGGGLVVFELVYLSWWLEKPRIDAPSLRNRSKDRVQSHHRD